MKIEFTKHAEDMLQERRFSRQLIEAGVVNPQWREQKSGEEWHAFLRIGAKVLRVVVRGREDSYTVITFFYDRRLR